MKPQENKVGKILQIQDTDINGNTVKIVIPEPSVLFGVDDKAIDSFLMYTSS